MQGHVKKFYPRLGVGIIAGADGAKYRFNRTELMNPTPGLVGAEVDFLLDRRSAKAIFVTTGSAWTAFGPAGHR